MYNRDDFYPNIYNKRIKGFSSDYTELQKYSNDCRNELLSYDRSLISSSCDVSTPIDSYDEVKAGRVIIKCFNTDYHCFINCKKKGLPLYVMLNGTVTGNYPEFKRWSWYPFIDGNLINIADPMYIKYDKKINLGWYWGHSVEDEGNYRLHISIIVKKISELLQSSEIIFYSSSGGCAASIQAADYIGGCTVVSINPQVVLSKFEFTKTFERVVGVKLNDEDSLHRNNVIPFIINGKNKHIIVQNICSPGDMKQYSELIQALDMNPTLGLVKKDNVVLWTYDGPGEKPHNSQENYCIYFVIKQIIDNFENLHPESGIYNLINEFWYQWLKKDMIVKREKTIQTLLPNRLSGVQLGIDVKNKMDPQSYKYAHLQIVDDVRANSKYTILIKKISVICGDIDQITVAITDSELKGMISSQSFSLEQEILVEFETGEKTDTMSVNVYPGKIGESQNKSFEIVYNIAVEKR